MKDFAIVTGCTPDHHRQLRWSLPTWCMKPQFAGKKLYVFVHGFKDALKELAWMGECFDDIQLVDWQMDEAENQRELMLSAFVLGAAQMVREPYFVKMVIR